MGWLRRKNPLTTAFGQGLLSLREDWESRIRDTQEIEEPNRIALLSASAGATVALGGFGAVLIQEFGGQVALVPRPDGETRLDPVVAFANRLSGRPTSIEAAYRVATWGLVAELGNFFWRPNYEIEMYECAKAFDCQNDYEGNVPHLGEPVAKGASVDEQGERKYNLVKGTLVNMVGAAIDEPVERDDSFLAMYFEAWHEQFNEGMSVANERLQELSPQGLPIWED